MFAFFYKNNFFNLAPLRLTCLERVPDGGTLTAYIDQVTASDVLADIKIGMMKENLLCELDEGCKEIVHLLEVVDVREEYYWDLLSKYEIGLECVDA